MEEFPFNIGQTVECKSNIKGYRGAWFRSQIKNIQIRRGEVWCAMQYLDFPDEKINFTKAYQQDPLGKKKRVLMLRPSFPLVCMGMNSEVINSSPGPVVVVNGNWSVGDLVDWYSDGCFWAAKIAAIINDGVLQVELPSAPLGEGGVYAAVLKDIRPSLDWSIEHRWSVPTPKSVQNNNKNLASLDQVIPVKEEVQEEHFVIAKQEPMWIIKEPTQNVAIEQSDEKIKQNVAIEQSDEKLKQNVAIEQHDEKIKQNVANEQGDEKLKHNVAIEHSDEKYKRKPWVLALESSDSPLRKAPTIRARHADVVNRGIVSADVPDALDGFLAQQTDSGLQPPVNAKTMDASAPKQQFDISSTLDTLDQTAQDIHSLIGEGKYIDLDDHRIISSIMALEELIGKVSWLRGVLQFGLKGWSQERKKMKWTLCKGEDLQACGSKEV